MELDDDDAGMTPFVDRSKVKAPATLKQRQTAVDITAEDIIPRLNPQNVADLVLISMVCFLFKYQDSFCLYFII